MENDNVTKEKDVESTDMTNEYIETIKQLKENSVPKADFEKLKEENKNLLQTLVDGGQVTIENEEEEVDIDELRDSLFNNDNTDIGYAEKALQLRDELIARGERDPFLPKEYTDADVVKAENVAASLRHCIDYAEGDNALFIQELGRIMIDAAPARSRK